MIENPADLFGPEMNCRSAAAIGAFDGLHLGHKHIIRAMVEYSRAAGVTPTVILFDPLPSQFFHRIGSNERILLRDEQEEMLSSLGAERIIILPFSEKIAALSPVEFLQAMQSRLHCERLFMGEDFSIGKDRTGNAATLSNLGHTFSYTTEVIRKDMMDGDVISSTRIRALLNSGKINEANRLLGYTFFFSGKIIHGEARGRKLGFPTLNIRIPEGKIILPNGVYAVYNIVEGKKYASVTNIGLRPTFNLESRGIVVESYLLNASGNFYGGTNRVEFVEKLRDEKRFNSADELKEQISRDIKRAETILL